MALTKKVFKETEFFDNYIHGFGADNHDSTKCMKLRKFKDTLVNYSSESHIKGDAININVTRINDDAQILNKLITSDDIFIGYININIAMPAIYDTFFLATENFHTKYGLNFTVPTNNQYVNECIYKNENNPQLVQIPVCTGSDGVKCLSVIDPTSQLTQLCSVIRGIKDTVWLYGYLSTGITKQGYIKLEQIIGEEFRDENNNRYASRSWKATLMSANNNYAVPITAQETIKINFSVYYDSDNYGIHTWPSKENIEIIISSNNSFGTYKDNNDWVIYYREDQTSPGQEGYIGGEQTPIFNVNTIKDINDNNLHNYGVYGKEDITSIKAFRIQSIELIGYDQILNL